MDAIAHGYEVIVIEELCRGVAPDTSQRTIEEMRQEGVKIHKTFNMEKIRRGNTKKRTNA